MADVIEKATNIVTLGMVLGLAYLGYKVADGLGFFKKDPKDPPKKDPPGTIIPTGANPVLDYWAQQPTTLNPTDTDLSKLTPTMQTPLGPLGLGVPDLLSGAVAKTANAVSFPILSTVWEWSMNQKYGDGWRDRMKWTDQGWQPLTVNDINYANAMATMGPSKDFSSIVTGPGQAPRQVAVPGLVPLDKLQAPMTSQSMGGTGSEILDTTGILDYINIGKAPDSQLDAKYRSPISMTPSPLAYRSKEGNLSSSDLDGPGDFWTPIPAPIRTVDTPPQPVNIPAAPVKILDTIAANPSMGSIPGIVYYNWQSGGVSKVPVSGIGWIQMSEAEARTRGIIK